KASTASENRTQPVCGFRASEAHLLFCSILPKAKENIQSPFRVVENVSPERQFETSGRNEHGSEVGFEFVSGAGQAVLRAVAERRHSRRGVTSPPAETESLPFGPVRLVPRGGSACVILQKLAGRVRYLGVVECREIRWEFHPPVSGLNPLKVVGSIPD